VAAEHPSLFEELKRRRVFRSLGAYGVFAFALLQVIEPVMHGFHWPDAVLSWAVVLLAAGFPAVVGLAWIFDFNAGHLERVAPTAGLGRTRLALLLAGMGLLCAAPGLAWYFAPRSAPAAPAAGPPPSIAVMPFLNLGADKEQEYFADGLAEELLNLLAKVPGLRVAARTSSFSFKGKDADLRTIGQQLHVSHVLEGSVRRSGDRLRITTQLIDVADGYHRWSETYDRQFTEVFAMQDEIATAVVVALKLSLLKIPDSRERRTAAPEAYSHYLLGRRAFLRGSLDDFRVAVGSYQRAIELDPGYAAAWAGLSAAVYAVAEEAESDQAVAAGFKRARAAAEKAVALGPDLPESFRARGYLRALVDWDWPGAATDLERALALDPESPDALAVVASLVLRPAGRLAEAEVLLRRATALDPLNPRLWSSLGSTLLYQGQTAPGRDALNRSLQLSPSQSFTAFNVALSLLLEGRPAEALEITQGSSSEVFRLLGAALAEHDLGHEAAWRRLVAQMEAKYAHSDAYQIAEAWAWCGETDLAFQWLDRARAQRDGGLPVLKVDPLLRSLRADPRWQRQLEGVNLAPR
jgi:TolB-like protein/cytochrome c-type biogenesis protein CcmH/NrfG